MNKYRWHRYTASESFHRIKEGENPWVAHGDFLDDWGRSQDEDRLELADTPLEDVATLEEQQWAALFAASIEYLCDQKGLPSPPWVKEAQYRLQNPWYLEARSENMRRYLRDTTPPLFAQHNVFGGDNVLDRA